MEEHLPPGFRFHPTDEELVTYYLARKVTEFGFVTRAIADVDLNRCEPWDLPGKASMGEKEWYFFSMKDRKYPTGLRTNRATNSGYWKTTGKDKEIFHCGVLVGLKKILVFYKGRAPKGEKTNWVIHEYRLQSKFPLKPIKEEWVVCRVLEKSSMNKKPITDSPTMHSLLESPCNTASLGELGDLNVSILNKLVNSTNFHLCCMPNYDESNGNSSNGNKFDMSMYMNWVLAREASTRASLPWLAGFPGTGMSPNPAATLKTLSFNVHQPCEAIEMAGLYSSVGQGDNHLHSEPTLSFAASSSKAEECASQHPQSFNQEPIWGSGLHFGR